TFDRVSPSSSHCRRTLSSGCSGSTWSRFQSQEGGSFFFHPLQLHLEPPDLLEQLGLLAVGRRGDLGPALEDGGRPGQELLLPVVDQRRVDAELGGHLVDRLVPLQ